MVTTQVVGPGWLERVLYLVVWGVIVGSSVGIVGTVVDSTDEIGPRVLAGGVFLPIDCSPRGQSSALRRRS